MKHETQPTIVRHAARTLLAGCLLAGCLLAGCLLSATAQHTRGIGIYPGRPAEYFGPALRTDTTYRNLALHRAVYQTEAYDFNLTAQLLTDGVKATHQPATLNVLANGKPLPANERELTINDSEWSSIPVEGSEATLTYVWDNMQVEADEILLEGFVAYDETVPFETYAIECQTTATDGKTLTFSTGGNTLPGTPRQRRVVSDPNKQTDEATAMARELKHSIPLKGKRTFSTMRLTMRQNNALYWSVKEVTFRRKGKAVRTLFPAQRFTSAWKAAKGAQAYVDLGTVADISEVRLHWLDGSASAVDISTDAATWTPLTATTAPTHDGVQAIPANARCRYVRVTLAGPSCLSEMEVYGRNGILPTPQPEQGWTADGRYMLNGGAWTLCPVSGPTPAATETGPAITATVPATVLSSYRNAGALPDPNYDDNLSMVSESFFNRDFLYRRTFTVPSEMKGRRVMLNLDGINWKATVTLNGKPLGRIEGAFTRGQFDITDLLAKDGTNHLCVYIEKNAHPGARKIKTMKNTSFNGGVLGGDNPTFHATIGWDWITTIPGRDAGIWNDVYLTATDAVIASDPIVTTSLTDGLATMTPSVFLRNTLATPVHGTLQGYIGDIRFDKEVTLAPHAETEITFSPQDYPQLADRHMKLWWPNGYGQPHLYQAGYTFQADGTRTPSRIDYKAGIRQVTYKDEASRLQLYVNGLRFVPLGGNWGFSENHLNYRGREYDIAVGYHRQMNCTMIRNWVGQTGDEEFYEACDRHGIMVWQDFWLANPVDGPNPDNDAMFMANATDYVRRIRRYPSIALYCGRNEGYPPESLNGPLADLVHSLSPGALYFPSSADDGVSGHGPYRALPVKDYFEKQTGKLHSERGMPNVPNHESLCRMLAPDHLWPQNEYWGKHDFTQQGAQYGSSFNELTRNRFDCEWLWQPDPMRLGTSPSQHFTTLAQWQNYDGYRAMYESSNLQRQGLIIWMSHSCWPSMVWQTYDYYFDPTAAFFGVKKACEPLHVQYNAATGTAQLVNLNRPMQDIRLTATMYDLRGQETWSKTMDTTLPTDTTLDCFPIEPQPSGSGTAMLRLRAVSRHDNSTLSVNTYFLADPATGTATNATDTATAGTQKDLQQTERTSISVSPAKSANPDEYVITNTGTAPALMLRLNLCGTDGEQILPVEYSDNYFHLLPGERMPVTIRWNTEDARGCKPVLHVSGLNVPLTRTPLAACCTL